MEKFAKIFHTWWIDWQSFSVVALMVSLRRVFSNFTINSQVPRSEGYLTRIETFQFAFNFSYFPHHHTKYPKKIHLRSFAFFTFIHSYGFETEKKLQRNLISACSRRYQRFSFTFIRFFHVETSKINIQHGCEGLKRMKIYRLSKYIFLLCIYFNFIVSFLKVDE